MPLFLLVAMKQERPDTKMPGFKTTLRSLCAHGDWRAFRMAFRSFERCNGWVSVLTDDLLCHCANVDVPGSEEIAAFLESYGAREFDRAITAAIRHGNHRILDHFLRMKKEYRKTGDAYCNDETENHLLLSAILGDVRCFCVLLSTMIKDAEISSAVVVCLMKFPHPSILRIIVDGLAEPLLSMGRETMDQCYLLFSVTFLAVLYCVDYGEIDLLKKLIPHVQLYDEMVEKIPPDMRDSFAECMLGAMEHAAVYERSDVLALFQEMVPHQAERYARYWDRALLGMFRNGEDMRALYRDAMDNLRRAAMKGILATNNMDRYICGLDYRDPTKAILVAATAGDFDRFVELATEIEESQEMRESCDWHRLQMIVVHLNFIEMFKVLQDLGHLVSRLFPDQIVSCLSQGSDDMAKCILSHCNAAELEETLHKSVVHKDESVFKKLVRMLHLDRELLKAYLRNPHPLSTSGPVRYLAAKLMLRDGEMPREKIESLYIRRRKVVKILCF